MFFISKANLLKFSSYGGRWICPTSAILHSKMGKKTGCPAIKPEYCRPSPATHEPYSKSVRSRMFRKQPCVNAFLPTSHPLSSFLPPSLPSFLTPFSHPSPDPFLLLVQREKQLPTWILSFTQWYHIFISFSPSTCCTTTGAGFVFSSVLNTTVAMSLDYGGSCKTVNSFY